ncbi:putative domain XH, Zinc finger-XS domain protein [Artemisia annua]|uniref:Putative domain XH, Zinc finger-XS domain protein n=1 Tax=Artemisia annua TaxID=35608 RepID=A0A2U1LH71_ARTAN|nr:putative domain XH, Zinc finger-XS domain protein [Artemisia annua]
MLLLFKAPLMFDRPPKERHIRSGSVGQVNTSCDSHENDAWTRCTGQENAIKLASLWQKHLGDPSWHPVKVITVDGQIKEIINEEEEKIRSLKDGFDEDVYNTIVTALNELNV